MATAGATDPGVVASLVHEADGSPVREYGFVTVPDFQTVMIPVLRQLRDGQEHASKEIIAALAIEFGLSDDDLAERIPSGYLTTWQSRVHWANTHLYQSRAIARSRRGVYSITDRGRQLLAQHPDRIVLKDLEQFKEFRDFRARGRAKPANPLDTTETSSTAPEPAAEVEAPDLRAAAAAEEANAAVESDLLRHLNEQPPVFLERAVLDLLVEHGSAGAKGRQLHLGKSGDEGFDGVIYQDKLGLDRVYVQAKRYRSGKRVGRPDLQGFVGALQYAQASRGVFITTSRYTNDARTYASHLQQRVILVDGDELAHLMVEHGVGVQTKHTFVLREIDEDYFAAE